MVDAMSGLAAVTGVLTLIKEAVGLASSVKDSAVKEKLLEVQARLGDVQIALNEQVRENLDLLNQLRNAQDQLRDAEASLRSRGERKLNDNVLWVRGEPVPYCALCDGKDQKRIPLMRDQTRFFCGVCNRSFYRPQPPADWGIQPIEWPPQRPPVHDDDGRIRRIRTHY